MHRRQLRRAITSDKRIFFAKLNTRWKKAYFLGKHQTSRLQRERAHRGGMHDVSGDVMDIADFDRGEVVLLSSSRRKIDARRSAGDQSGGVAMQAQALQHAQMAPRSFVHPPIQLSLFFLSIVVLPLPPSVPRSLSLLESLRARQDGKHGFTVIFHSRVSSTSKFSGE